MAKRKENEAENHSFLFEDMAVDELKDTVIRRWKEIKSLEAEKKDYVSGIKDTITELTEQIDSLVYWIGVKETTLAKEKLVEAANIALSADVGD